MSKSIGFVGLPNAGKSTLFNFLVKNSQEEKDIAKVSPVMFSTIQPNKKKTIVKDERLDKLGKDSQRIIYPEVEFVDIAGLIEGAHEGAGKGNSFLSDISKVDLIAYVIRGFEDELVPHLLDRIDTLEDFNIVRNELLQYDLKKIPKASEDIKKKLTNFEIVEGMSHLLTQKPAVIIINGTSSKTFPYPTFFLDLSKENNKDDFIKHCFEKLGYIMFFTTGEKETRGWRILKESNLPTAASVIHSDFNRPNLKAELITNNSKTIVNSNYIVKDGDILHFF